MFDYIIVNCQLYQFFFDLYVSRAYEQGIRDEGEEERFGGKAPNCDTNLETKTMQMATTRQGDELPKQYLKRNPTVQMAAIAATEFAMTRKPLWRPRLRSISPRDIFSNLHRSLWRMIGYLFRQMSSSRGRRRRASKACHSHIHTKCIPILTIEIYVALCGHLVNETGFLQMI